jgi:RpiR family transcriptional regulator, carbohydrate utilization regulator
MLPKIRAQLPNLTPAEARAAQQLLNDPHLLLHASIGELAVAWDVSEPTLVRLSKALGCSGFQALRVQVTQALALMDAAAPALPALHFEDSSGDVIAKVFAHATACLQQTRAALKSGALDQAVGQLVNARRVMLFADTAAAHTAQEAAARFLQLDMPLLVFTDFVSQGQMAALTQPGDVVILLSLSGSAPQWLRTLETLSQREVAVLVVTTSGSPLARAVPAHIALDVAQGGDPFMPDAAPVASLLLLESLALAVALRRGKALARKLKRAGLRPGAVGAAGA